MTGDTTAKRPLKLVVHFGCTYVATLEFHPNALRAFTVGSGQFADVRVERREIAPIAFFLEREGDRIRLTKAYGDASLRLGGRLVQRSELLTRRNTVQVGPWRWHLETTCGNTTTGTSARPVAAERDVTLATGGDASGKPQSSERPLDDAAPQQPDATLVDQPARRERSAPPPPPSRRWLALRIALHWSRLVRKPRIVTFACAVIAAFIALLLAVATSKPGDGFASARSNEASSAGPGVPSRSLTPTAHATPSAIRGADSGDAGAVWREPQGVAPASADTPPDAGLPPSEDSDPLVTEAVEHLAAGRLAQARDAYTVLAARYSTRPAYATVAKLLGRGAIQGP